MTVSVVVPHYGRSELTVACLLAVAQHSPLAEVVVVDNGSGDRFTADVRVNNDTNLGFAVACNQGAAVASGDVVVFLNNDTEVHAGWLDPLAGALDSAEVAGSLLLYPDGRVQHAGIRLYRTPSGVLTAENRQEAGLPAGEVEAVTGASMAVRRDVFFRHGGFDEEYWNGYEDVDFCLTVRRAGGTVRFEPASVVTHHESASGPARWAGVHRNIRRLQEKWSGVTVSG